MTLGTGETVNLLFRRGSWGHSDWGLNRESDLIARDEIGCRAIFQGDWRESKLGVERLGLRDLILRGVRQGVASKAPCQVVQKEVQSFKVYETGTIEPTIEAAATYRCLCAARRAV